MGRKHHARELLKRMRARIAGAESGVRRHPKVMLILGVGHAPFVFLPNSWGGGIVRAAGGELATGGATSGSGFQRISDEVVVAENPDVIIAVPHADPEDIPALTRYLKNDPAWSLDQGGEDRPPLRLGRQLAAAGGNRHRPHDHPGARELPP